jgi:predicted ATPase
MRISNLTYKDKALKWELEKAEFETLTLLVGASGVGKTQILNSILKLKGIANGKSISGIYWKIQFETLNGNNYLWEGEFENKGDVDYDDNDDDEIKRNKPSILFEILTLNNEHQIINRTPEFILFNGSKTVKLPNQQSVIYLLKEEELVKPAFEGFGKILFSDQTESTREAYRIKFSDTQKLLKSIKNIRQIQESKEDIRIKLFLAYKNAPKVFEIIRERYIGIFPQVEDIKVEPLDQDDDDVPFFYKEYPFIQIKEKGIDKWIKQHNISSGMFRSLIHISEIYLCNEGSVFLIDEFENSLGINCINELTNDILSSKRKTQFIITSHHPYIINNVDYTYWKLVTRTKGVVKTHKPEKFKIGKSKHDAFMQLIQLEQYQTGLEV